MTARALAVPAALLLAACGGSDGTKLEPPGRGSEAPPTSQPPPVTETPALGPAVMLVGQAYTPEDYLTYVGVYPQVPEGEVDFANFREFGNANVYSNAGYIFVEQDGIVQRLSVDAELQLVDGPRFSWQEFGIAAINATSTVFISERRAYTLAPDLGVIIVWDPEQMVRTGTLPFEMPERPADMETFAYDGFLVGDKVVWNIFSGSFETGAVHPAVTLAIADAASDVEPVRVVEDSRCIPGGPGHVDDAGNYFVHAGGYYGYFIAYGDAGPDARGCILRVNAGEREIDPEFIVDYASVTGSHVSEPWFHVTGSQFMARSWDPAVPFPENPDEFWENVALHPLLVDTEARTAQPYPDLEGVRPIDGSTRKVDGVSYYQVSQTGYVENGDTDVVELHPDGIRSRFHLNGFLLGLERLR